MPDPPFDIGDSVRLRTTITDGESASPVAPSALSIHVRAPNGSLASYTLGAGGGPTAIASGIYQIDLPVLTPGTWNYRWVATGPMAAESGRFPVASNPVV